MQTLSERMKSFNINKIHLIGIGGIGMSGIAEILVNFGYQVQGSDVKKTSLTERLETLGIKIFYSHDANNLKNVDLVVKSSAINDSNPEIIEALAKSLLLITRAEILAEIMRSKTSIAVSGTHGKTTTTSLIGCLLESAKLDPTIINGGIINNKASNIYIGKGDFLVAEADESDSTFIKIPSIITVITNINPEHLDFYGSFEKLKEAYQIFIKNLPFYGFAVICKDHPELRNLSSIITDKKIITYGINSEQSDVKAINIRQCDGYFLYDVIIDEKLNYTQNLIKDIYLPAFGIHNVSNSLAAISVAIQLKISPDLIKNGFRNFTGVKRRFTQVGEFNNIKFIDDYAHHPVEIQATLTAAKSLNKKRIIAIFQPHRFTRVQNLFTEFLNSFKDVDILFVADIHSANEKEIEGITQKNLIDSIRNHDKLLQVEEINLDDNPDILLSNYLQEGDLVIFLGAGTITNYAHNLPKKLEHLMKNKN